MHNKFALLILCRGGILFNKNLMMGRCIERNNLESRFSSVGNVVPRPCWNEERAIGINVHVLLGTILCFAKASDTMTLLDQQHLIRIVVHLPTHRLTALDCHGRHLQVLACPNDIPIVLGLLHELIQVEYNSVRFFGHFETARLQL